MNGSVIQGYADSLQDRTDLLFKSLVDIGKTQVADADGYTEGGEIVVTATPTQSGATLSASGKGVLVIEFGAGTTVDSGHIYAGFFSNVVSGGYSSSVGTGEFSTYGKWHFGGREYTHITPRRGMLHASTKMKKNILKIAKKVFRGTK